ncbi:2'-5' RNA ligase family protein [Haloferula sp. BvORR071]|uniref:2'-5' RNA ligase family protein n=1 Tax=Haloferula sp. BvORR071 TaxID=1396141 RepID=UPI000698FD26|nr:2'-5' RNA ligase family protein [Haloferula sp. BvORR071]
MPHAIELFFDDDSDLRIRKLWERLAGLGATYMHSSGARPHLTLAVCDSIDLPAASRLLDGFGENFASFPLQFAATGFFPGEKPVMFLAPKVTSELLQLQEQFHEELSLISPDIWPNYTPAKWMPHCTLAMDLPREQCGQIAGVIDAAALPFEVEVVSLGMVEFRPVKLKHTTRLTLRT